jgi:hypothetical protein
VRGTFIEARSFTQSVSEYFADDVDYQEFQISILENPEKGDVIQGCGGLRKVRWRHQKRGKGSSGGLRVIYLHVPEVAQFFLLDVYSKDEAEDLSREERKFLAELAEEYKSAAISKPRRKRG